MTAIWITPLYNKKQEKIPHENGILDFMELDPGLKDINVLKLLLQMARMDNAQVSICR